MRRLLLLPILALTLAVVLAACSSASEPGWTYAAPTPAPSQPATAAPSTAPPSEAPSGEPGVLTLTAQNIEWVQTELSAPADTEFTIRLDNQDNGVPHDVVVRDASGAEVARSEVVTGVGTTDLVIPGLAAGTYGYICSIHPATMIGTLTVGG
jgi:hypothetical protein